MIVYKIFKNMEKIINNNSNIKKLYMKKFPHISYRCFNKQNFLDILVYFSPPAR